MQLDNAGFAICMPEEVWVVDGVQIGASIYGGTTSKTLDWLASRKEPLGLIVTHAHNDHVNPEMICDLVERRQKMTPSRATTVYGFDEDIQMLFTEIGAALTVVVLEKDVRHPLSAHFAVTGIPSPHMFPKRYTLAHHSLLLECDIAQKTVRIFATADADFEEAYYQSVAPRVKGCDIAIAPFSYGITKKHDALLKKYIDPHVAIVNHFPPMGSSGDPYLEKFHKFRDKYYPMDPLVAFTAFGDALDLDDCIDTMSA